MLIGNGQDHTKLFIGYMIGAAIMVLGGLVEVAFGVAAEGRSLEDLATPLSAARSPRAGDPPRSAAGSMLGDAET
jgi:hypothetical protein